MVDIARETASCIGCGATLPEILDRLGSVRCHICRCNAPAPIVRDTALDGARARTAHSRPPRALRRALALLLRSGS